MSVYDLHKNWIIVIYWSCSVTIPYSVDIECRPNPNPVTDPNPLGESGRGSGWSLNCVSQSGCWYRESWRWRTKSHRHHRRRRPSVTVMRSSTTWRQRPTSMSVRHPNASATRTLRWAALSRYDCSGIELLSTSRVGVCRPPGRFSCTTQARQSLCQSIDEICIAPPTKCERRRLTV